MKLESITYLVECFCNNKLVKSYYETNEVNFTRTGTMMMSCLTGTEIYETAKNTFYDLEKEQCDAMYGVITVNGISYIGIPTVLRLNLSVFQMRRSKLAIIGEMIAEPNS
jgi:hypothetical protein